MRLFQCDAHLEYARLALAEGNREKVVYGRFCKKRWRSGVMVCG